MNSTGLYSQPVFGAGITVVAYALSLGLRQRWRWIHPLLVTCGLVIVVLLAARVPYEDYKIGGNIVTFFLGPATVALGVPFYRHARQIRAHLGAIVAAVTAGSLAGMISGAALVYVTGGSREVLVSMIPKSVTTPISIEIARLLHGNPSLAALFTVLAGLLGSVIGPGLLRRLGIRGDLAIGVAMGTSSHGIGTARVLADSELQGGASGLAMALAGVITSLLAIPVSIWLR